jgi:hypothetical protein
VSEVSDFDVRARNPLERLLAWLGPVRGYTLTRWLILRLLGVVYVFAFLGLIFQGPPLFGEHGITPIGTQLDQLRAGGATFWDVPSVLWFDSSDGAIVAWAVIGLLLAIALAGGYANLPSLLVLWAIYGSFERVDEVWFRFGWEMQLLETTLIAACLVHPWDPRPVRAPSPPTASIVLARWLVFRIMLGAGLIKLRNAGCWSDLTCLDAHFETQPIPNPLSPLFHHMPQPLQAAGVAINHVVEVALPWLVFGPRRARLVAGVAMAGFQITLIASGNLAFLNWLTLIPILALFDDDFLLRLSPRRLRAWLAARMPARRERDGKQLAIAFGTALVVIVVWQPILGGLVIEAQIVAAALFATGFALAARRYRAAIASPGTPLDGHQLAIGCFVALVAIKSVAVVGNLGSSSQKMNASFDRLSLVNTYGAFGSVTMARKEIIIEGTLDRDPHAATWSAYELPCKPGDLARRPCTLGPYHRRLDWLVWFAAMPDQPRHAWLYHVVWKLLDGDRSVRELFAHDPFDGAKPHWIRIRRFTYHLEPYGSATWWTRDDEQIWLQPMSLDTPGFRRMLGRFGWPSPSG